MGYNAVIEFVHGLLQSSVSYDIIFIRILAFEVLKNPGVEVQPVATRLRRVLQLRPEVQGFRIQEGHQRHLPKHLELVPRIRRKAKVSVSKSD